MKREEFAGYVISQGLTGPDVVEAMRRRRNEIGPFEDDEIADNGQPKTAADDPNIMGLLKKAKDALVPGMDATPSDSTSVPVQGQYPGFTSLLDVGKAPVARRATTPFEKGAESLVKGALSAADWPVRALGAATGQGAGNSFAERMSDPTAAITKGAKESQFVQSLPAPAKIAANVALSAFDNPFLYMKGAATGVARASTKVGASGAIKGLGENVLNKAIAPSSKDIGDGFRMHNVVKHGLDKLPVEKAYEKMNAEIFPALEGRMKSALGQSKTKFDVEDALKKTEADLLADSPKNAAVLKEVSSQFDGLVEQLAELESRGFVSNGTTDMLTANAIKRSYGKKGAWAHGIQDPMSTAREKVANAFFKNMKTGIEKSDVGDEIKAINKEFGELMPIEHALIRRIPVSARQEFAEDIGTLGIVLGGKVMTTAAVMRGLKKPGVGSALYRFGEKLKKRSAQPLSKQAAPAATYGAVKSALVNPGHDQPTPSQEPPGL